MTRETDDDIWLEFLVNGVLVNPHCVMLGGVEKLGARLEPSYAGQVPAFGKLMPTSHEAIVRHPIAGRKSSKPSALTVRKSRAHDAR